MKKITILLFSILFSTSLIAQDITGQWYGVLKVPGAQLSIVFNIHKTATGFSGTMDSPDQKVKGIAVKETYFEDNKLRLVAPNLGLEFIGVLNPDQTIKGDFKQSGQTFPLILSRAATVKEKVLRPQTPTPPYSYYSEEVTFPNPTANISLAGTLTLPKKEGIYPVVVLISGSGPQNRDEELFDHQPFLVLSDYLTRNGFAVLRYDDRGIEKSEGNFNAATTQDFASDVESALKYLRTRKEINPKKIGLIGHSEGGLIAPMVAAKDKDLAFIVLLAGPGVPISDLMLLQKEKMERQAGVSEVELLKNQEIFKGAYQLISNTETNDVLFKATLAKYFGGKFNVPASDKEVLGITGLVTSPWTFNFLKLNPADFLKNVRCPVFAINGEYDIQVTPKENLQAIKMILDKSGNKKVTVKELPTLNHLFQESKTGAVSEYGTIEQTISPMALTEILNWLKLQIK
jgi:pimeloyl-ACP methyl ester carboxylesterase